MLNTLTCRTFYLVISKPILPSDESKNSAKAVATMEGLTGSNITCYFYKIIDFLPDQHQQILFCPQPTEKEHPGKEFCNPKLFFVFLFVDIASGATYIAPIHIGIHIL